MIFFIAISEIFFGSLSVAPISMILRATISVRGSLRSTRLNERKAKRYQAHLAPLSYTGGL